MRPVLPADVSLVDQPDVCLVDEGFALQGMVVTLAAQLMSRHLLELAINDGHQFIQRLGISVAPRHQQSRDVL